jgi:oligoribonuclease NrnB/cAMP/cGMP phosphodiesterase (DHH superfamily)
MKPLIIFHDHCTDGFAAAFSAWLKFGDDAEYYPANYGDASWSGLFEGYAEDSSKFDGRDVYILDFSFSKVQMLHIINDAKSLTWLDHHKSAFENWLDGNPDFKPEYFLKTEGSSFETYSDTLRITLNNFKSGAMLAWEHFHPEEEVPHFIKWVDDRDRWQFKLEESEAFHAGMSSIKPWTFKKWEHIIVDYDRTNDIVSQGKAILTAKNQEVKSLAKYAREVVINPDEVDFEDRIYPEDGKEEFNVMYKGLAVNSPLHMSEIGHELANVSGTFGLIWYLGKENRAKISLRSNGDYDVSAIAKIFGGGGHKNASGFEVSIETLIGWMV